MRLPRRTQLALYATFGGLLATGIAWFLLDRYVTIEGEFGPEKHPATLWLIRGHGALAMLALVLIGMLLPIHARHGWRLGRHRRSGGTLLAATALLAVTGYGLYYFGSEPLRTATSWLHLGIGVVLPTAIVIHAWRGWRSSRHPPAGRP